MIVSLISFVVSHAFACLVSVALPVVLVILTYFALFIAALIYNSGLGSPLALPFWAVASFLVSLAYTGLFLFPSVAIAEAVSLPFGLWRPIVQVPVSALVLAVLISVMTLAISFIANHTGMSFQKAVEYSEIALLILIVPWGLYWVAMKTAQLIIALPGMILKSLRRMVFKRT